ncbi:palmdelphin-like isoform X1 [Salvelinus sp. IW2-2015]|uniref:palmdelphin-like isoform X1 n=1 Tax=Salvelinus sp. IW2-2015 TaxID=2691554 RepID=UPI0038D43640
MEEAELVKDRLQAITDKRKVQEDIVHKKLEIDKEKLKLQHLKKKSLREQWLMDGTSNQSSQQRETLRGDQQQTKLLQTSIHRIEKEIEALEREETMISKNEGFILKRLKAIEKTPEEIIKEAKENFKEEPIHINPATLDAPKSYKPPISKKQSFESNKDTPKQTMFAMEINVQKDLRTGETRVLSTSTVTPQVLQQRGVKVYDDGRKSVYALRSDESQLGDGSNRVDELSPMEVEVLLRAATEQKKSQSGQRCHQGYQESVSAFSTNCGPQSHQKPTLPVFSTTSGSWRHHESVPTFSTPRGSRGHQELSPMEVEEQLRKGTVQKMPQSGAFPKDHRGHQESVPAFSNTCSRRASVPNRPQQSHAKVIHETNGNGYQQESYKHDVLSRKELHYIDGVHNSELESLSSSPHIPVHSFIGRQDEEYYQSNNGYNQNPLSYGVEKGFPTDDSYHSPREIQRSGMFYDSSVEMDQRPSPIYQGDSHFSILNTMDTSEPVTAIFMGYQTAEDDSGRGLGYEGSIRAELVVIGDEDGVDESNPQFYTYTADGYNNRGYHHCQPQQNLIKYMAEPTANFNSNNASPYTASRNLVYPGQLAKESHYLYSDGQSDEDGTEKHSAPASSTSMEKPEQLV